MNTHLTIEEWETQFTRQAAWTRAVRSQLYRRANLLRAERVLDVGCGTGVVTEELSARTRGQVIAVDIDPAMIAATHSRSGQAEYRVGDARQLDFPDHHFNVVACHFLLMWVDDAARAVREMARVTRPGGAVLICGEADYGGRVDWPDLPVGQWQAEALQRQGAYPFVGRKLRELLRQAGLDADVGVISSLWDTVALRENFAAEWALLERDVAGQVDETAFGRARDTAWKAIEEGTRLVFMPVFFGLGRRGQSPAS
ncbi:MAG: methyltransferase domain-containing protein [Chloroflexota bacterium]|nr:methyltransferase domain-containing protein [Chloroflexota bacterium]